MFTSQKNFRVHRNDGRPVRLLPLLLLALVGSAQGQQLIWSDEFDSDGRPDAQHWSYDLGATGWGNQELQQYTDSPDNVRVENGSLFIEVREQASGAPFTSARIRTEDKLTVKYGTIEARIKMPDLEDGLWPAFWTLGNNFRTVGWPACGELDIVEMGSAQAINLDRVNRRVGSTAHWENNGVKADYGLFLDAPSDLNGEWHVFRMEWTPEFVTTYLDGQQIWRMDIRPESCTDCTEFHQPHFIILNVAVGGTYTQRFSAGQITANLPAQMEVDYVRVYDNGFTEVAGSGFQPGPPDIGPAHSGSWYNEGQSGHGFSIEFGENPDGPLGLVYWYVYDTEGAPLFMLGTGVPEGNRIEVTFLSPTGMIYGDFDADSVALNDGGTAVLEFNDKNDGTFSYTPSEFSASVWGHTPIEDLPITKLFAIPAPDRFPEPAD